jgi:hypothetical protein
MANTGYKQCLTRMQVMVDPTTGLPDPNNPTGLVEANDPGENYIENVWDIVTCPLPPDPPAAPVNFTTSWLQVNVAVSLTWTAPASTYPIVEYDIWRRESYTTSVSYRKITGAPPGTSTVDTPNNPGGAIPRYYYKIRAKNSYGDYGPFSPEVWIEFT